MTQQEAQSTSPHNQNGNKWRVSWNKKFYKQNSLEVGDEFAQSKGRAKMRSIPCQGDLVYIACGGKCIYKGIVISDGFLEGIDHQEDTNNLGGLPSHRQPREYARIKITSKPINPGILRGVQRTWSKCHN
jgi:hypothetical protein